MAYPFEIEEIFTIMFANAPFATFHSVNQVCKLFHTFCKRLPYQTCVCIKYDDSDIECVNARKQFLASNKQFCHIGLSCWFDLEIIPVHLQQLTLVLNLDVLITDYFQLDIPSLNLHTLNIHIKHELSNQHIDIINNLLSMCQHLKRFTFKADHIGTTRYTCLMFHESIEECEIDAQIQIKLPLNIRKCVNQGTINIQNANETFSNLIHYEGYLYSKYDYVRMFPNLKICKAQHILCDHDLPYSLEQLILSYSVTHMNLTKYVNLKSLTFIGGYLTLNHELLPSQLKTLRIETEALEHSCNFPGTLKHLFIKCDHLFNESIFKTMINSIPNLKTLYLKVTLSMYDLNIQDFPKLEKLFIYSSLTLDSQKLIHDHLKYIELELAHPLFLPSNVTHIHIHSMYMKQPSQFTYFMQCLPHTCQYLVIDEINQNVCSSINHSNLKGLMIQNKIII